MVSGSLSLPSSGCFSPFPHGTCTLSVSWEYLALPDGPGGFTQDFSCPALLRITPDYGTQRIRSSHPLWPAVPGRSAVRAENRSAVLQPPGGAKHRTGLGCSPFARHYWGNHSYFLFLRVLRCFSSPRMPSAIDGVSCLQHDGLSHSEIRGSMAICASPRLIAAYHVLHRWQEPRHPPYALSHFLRHARPQKKDRLKRRI